jgi:hypothetical protein
VTSGQRKLLKLAVRALFIRECRSGHERDARAAVIDALSNWAAPSTIFAFLPPDEVEAGIELAKELIKAVYQYKGLLARLQALKKPVT